MRRRLLVLLAMLAAVAAQPALAKASTAFSPCANGSKIECATVTVPLDRTGAVPGSVDLRVERVFPGSPRGVMLLIAGGPGQPGTSTFALAQSALSLRQLFPGYALATFDIRGTGGSGPLACPALQALLASADAKRSSELVGECGSALGDNRRFYSTRDHADDLDAVRQALGVDKIALWGTSYGTKLALAYALVHPEHVDRLLLDSVVPPEGLNPYGTDTLRALPAALSSVCDVGKCRSVTADFAGEVAALANRLASTPARGNVLTGAGRTQAVRLDGVQFLSLVVDADLNPGLAAELPAAVHAALKGNVRPLLRLQLLDTGDAIPAASLNAALLAATFCDDGGFAWQPDTPVAARQALIDAAVAALPPGATGPFGSWATDIGTSSLCKLWPAQSPPSIVGSLPLPDVPVLVVAGGRDTRTPAAGAAAVAARFPHGHLVVVPGVGHSVIGADVSGCASRAVVKWITGGDPGQCQRPPDIISPVAAFPASVGALAPAGRAPGKVGRTVAAAIRTLRESGAAWATGIFGLAGSNGAIAGIYSGQLLPGSGLDFTLRRYSIVPGVQLSGKARIENSSTIFPFGFSGTMTISGAKAAPGTIQIAAGRVRGLLGGRRIDAAAG